MSPAAAWHPLDPLTPDEITGASLAVRKYIAIETDVKAVKFITCYLLPPPKKAVLAYLGIPLAPGAKPEAPVPITRKAEADIIDLVNGRSFNVILSFQEDEWKVDTFDLLEEGLQPQISVEELLICERIVRQDPLVIKLAKDVGVSPEEINCEGWSIGFDERFPKSLRLQQGIFFARFSRHDNHYAHPMDFIAVVDSNSEKVLHVEFAAHYKPSPNGPSLSAPSTQAPPLEADQLAHANRGRIPPPRPAFDFLPDLMATTQENFKLRDDVKPLHIMQPEGVSFKLTGTQIEWQNWKFHIGFNHREGLALSTITYNDHGEVRPVIYRLSLAEMVVPYAAPEHPHARKFAFDSGEYGMGAMANELTLGCDCLGQIHYLPGVYVNHDGSPHVIQNCICIHEEDAGVLWKHSDFRPGGRSQTVRRRRLVVSMVCTLANYGESPSMAARRHVLIALAEYIFNYMFYQDGSIELEIRLTGVLQVYIAADGEQTPYGTIVAPNVSAQYHQHIFSIRVDPMVDGIHNSLVETDIMPAPAPTGSAENFAGNAFTATDTVLKTAAAREHEAGRERRWRVVNPARTHYSTKRAVGYGLGVKGAAVQLMTQHDGWVGRRATFTKKALWVCRDEEGAKGGRMWPAGKYVPQTRDAPADSIGNWVEDGASIENEDILVYLTVGVTHIPRPEDWPVMPVEHLNVYFKPQSFFDANPSMDVPGVRDPHSVPAFGATPQTCH
ncbi:copper amine oxidase [Mycena belliarum]|uniref:Amine oxidase n=1 Tax=Mycena belliarum TaxID=1033014 RepID=A0AAD6XXF6_9AGAR|nr:copper amine oxidase [Mycena belliae]